MKRVQPCLWLIFLLPALVASAEPAPGRFVLNPESQGQPRLLVGSESISTEPSFVVQSSDASGCRLDFHLTAMLMEELTVEGARYSALTIPGGGMSGLAGEPGLPTYSGLLAVPEGSGIQVESIALGQRKYADMRVLPFQPDAATEFVMDAAVYSGQKAAGKRTDQHDAFVILGDPAIYHGVRVVPFTIQPVSFDPQKNEITTISHLEVNFVFSGDDQRAKSRRSNGLIPESFAGLLRDQLVNADQAGLLAGFLDGDKADGQLVGPGTYLVISPPIASITAELQPLLDWRSRQGYTVKHVTTAQTGTSTSNIKNYIQGVYDNAVVPLEFVVLVGDADGTVTLNTWHETLSGDWGEGDHYYTTLDGDDILSDVLIGRLSVRNPTQLRTIVSKIIGYETNPPLVADPDWIQRASVASDPSSSGITTIYVAQWLKAQLQNLGYTKVDTIFGGNFPSQMYASLNQGLGAFAYRGFGGMSGFTTGHINSLSNGGKLPFAVIPTCNTGSFHTYQEARSEAFLRTSGGGAIGCIALSTGGTHTRYNNCLYHGIWEGMLYSGSRSLGAAQSHGKMEVYKNYFSAEPNIPEIWAVWTNLMGDPATDMWQKSPATLLVSHPSELPVGAVSVPVTVTVDGAAVSGLRVALYKEGEVTASGYTNASGSVNIPLYGYTAGTLLVTVTGHDCLPYRGSLALGLVDVFAGLNESILDDGDSAGQGNGDGSWNPGETLDIRVSLTNFGTNLAGGVSAILTTNDPYATVTDANETFGDIAPGGINWSSGSFAVAIAADTPADHPIALSILATDGSETWASSLSFKVESAALAVSNSEWGGAGPTPDPGESGDLSLTLRNSGTVASGVISATLTTESPWIAITDDQGEFGNINPGGQSQNSANPFALTIAGDCFAGHLATFTLETTFVGGATQSVVFQLTVGQAGSDDPLGPDSYGYYALDNTDTGYSMAPIYDWVEIDPNHGGSGTSVGLTDNGWEQDDTRTMDLPFSFRYYGEQYDEIAICSNGWLAMGATTLKHYRNYSIPSAGSPDRMIAPFWDNLNQVGDNQVYTWYDAAQFRFIIQWSRMPNYPGHVQNFQVILHDPQAYPTATNDGKILFQYETVNNTDVTNGYATAGIQNTDGTDGLLYTYWNEYASAAAPLVSGRAIMFLPVGAVPGATCDISPSAINITLAPDTQADRVMTIANNGETGSVLNFNISKVDPDSPVLPAGGDKSLQGSTLVASHSQYDSGTVMDIDFTATCSSPDDEWIISVSLDFPLGVVVNSGTNMNGANGGLSYNGASGDGVIASWGGEGFLSDGNSGTGSLNLDFSSTVGTVEIPFVLTGDNFGGPPHSISGTIVLEQSGPSVLVAQPNGGELWAEGETRTIQFNAGGGVENVRIELDRGQGSGWELLADDYPAGSGAFEWLVTGPISAHCRVKITDQIDSLVLDQSDGDFTIGRSLAWLQLDQEFGVINQGSPESITLTIDTDGLAEGTYSIDLIVSNSAGSPVVVPVRLTVSNGVSPTSELPTQLALNQNHPNPFNPQTSISFSLPAAGNVHLKVYNATGRLVRTLVDGSLPAGAYQQVWDGTDSHGHRVASGVYLYRLETPGRKLTRKMLMVK